MYGTKKQVQKILRHLQDLLHGQESTLSRSSLACQLNLFTLTNSNHLSLEFLPKPPLPAILLVQELDSSFPFKRHTALPHLKTRLTIGEMALVDWRDCLLCPYQAWPGNQLPTWISRPMSNKSLSTHSCSLKKYRNWMWVRSVSGQETSFLLRSANQCTI